MGTLARMAGVGAKRVPKNRVQKSRPRTQLVHFNVPEHQLVNVTRYEQEK